VISSQTIYRHWQNLISPRARAYSGSLHIPSNFISEVELLSYTHCENIKWKLKNGRITQNFKNQSEHKQTMQSLVGIFFKLVPQPTDCYEDN
jgi:hypothetical protein